MLCEHLAPLESAMIARGMRETYRGRPWSMNCREWVIFDCYINAKAVRQIMTLPECVQEHSHRGTHDGEESGFVCHQCWDAIIGYYEAKPGQPNFEG